ncbi:hypothetical protein PV08_11665 [Exophiala spinifera]|uniref:AMP-dependent synthetase/ligase domain-containing protein n=1 Tax=Exophiala spinifera TaxID=91928 RepID=A0A0D1Y727_9EURO|nr:uncharacterized protein PV08_11665 [Exophiala spinifera]KIW10701.1 hypothetical protein PV08_11665 [Exophiala spinifera]
MAKEAFPLATIESEVASLPLPRLLPNLVADRASREPHKIWGSIPVNLQITRAGYEDISYRRLNYAIDRAAYWMHNTLEPGRLRAFEPLAYLGPPDTRYIIFALAAIKAGFQMLYLSPRNSYEVQYAVMKEAECHKWLFAAEMKPKVEGLVANRPPQVLNMTSCQTECLDDTLNITPGVAELLTDEPTHAFGYNRSLEEMGPIGYASYIKVCAGATYLTTVTTGLPQLIPLTQGYGFREDVIQYYPTEDRLDIHTRKPFDGDCRLFLAMPLFHAGGVLLGLLKSLYHDIVMVFQPPAVPLSAAVVSGILRHGKCDGTVIPPFLMEEMLSVSEYFDTLAALKFVQFGSGRLSKYCGDTLLTRQKSCPHFMGTSESGIDMRSIDDSSSLCELYIKKIGVDIPGLQPIFELFPHLTEWATRDLYVQHPEKPCLWRTCGRADNVIVLSTGEKLNPVDTESLIAKAHPAITGALVVGQGRFQPALLLEVKGIDRNNESEKNELLNAIWTTIEAANKTAPKHGQLTAPLTLFSSPEKPFLRTPKLSVRRKPTADLYLEEIEALYCQVETEARNIDHSDVPKNVDLSDRESIQNSVQLLIGNVTGWATNPSQETDLFMQGMDSLHVVRLVRPIKAAVKGSMRLDRIADLTSKIIYNNPTIGSLSEALNDIIQDYPTSGPPDIGKTDQGGAEDQARGKSLQQLIDRWTQDWDWPLEILRNGSTGSLGSHILEKLLHHPSVSKVVCLNRAVNTAAK